MPPRSLLQRHRGWLVVLGAFLIQMVGFGAIYSSSAFAPEIAASLNMDRAYADLVMVPSLGGSFLVSAISGSVADRFGPRPLAAFGMMLVAAGLALTALAQTAFTVFLGYGLLLGLGLPRRLPYPKRKAGGLALAVSLLSLIGFGAGMLAASPRSAAAEALVLVSSAPATTRAESWQGESR